MSWDVKDVITRRHEFVTLASSKAISMAALCRRFGISRKTGYKWRTRYAASGESGLRDQVRRADRRANQTPQRVEQWVRTLRGKHPTWGPRKLKRRLQDLGHAGLPGLSTFARILKRGGCVAPELSQQHHAWRRFNRPEPNQLWQMDFKGHFPLQRGGRCHPLTVLDDCSRYALGLDACADQCTLTVQEHLRLLFTRYGLPESILCDNGPPWGGTGPEYTALTVWLLRLGVPVLHGRPFHPQTQGKDERFHRTLQADLLARHDWLDLVQAQRRFDDYRRLYNHDRPHEALALAVPAARYRPSARPMPTHLPQAEYDENELVRAVKSKGEITFNRRFYYIGQAFIGLTLALRPTAADGRFRVCYAAFPLGLIDLTQPADKPRGHYYPILPLARNCYP